jgi:fructose-1-phosphate kinase PfkB-like protein
VFANISNHPSARWGQEQTAAANNLGGEIKDIKFPNVPPTATSEEVSRMAAELAAQVMSNDVVMVSGEFSLTYALTKRLRNRHVSVVVACTERTVEEVVKPDGSMEKKAVFRFVNFRAVE